MTRFIVFTSPRSGSSWLIDLLDAHQRVGAYAELFLPGDRTEPSYGSKDLPRFEATLPPGASSRRVMLAPRRIAYLNRLYSKSEMDAVGFKLMYGHPRMHPGLLPYLALRRVRALHLVRTNLLDQVLSWETARARGLFRAYAGDDFPQTTVRLETEPLVDRLEELEARIERGRRTLRRMRVPTLEIEYEQLVERPAALISEAFRFLNVDSADDWAPGSTLVRMNWTPRLELIENVDEVARTLRGTRFSSMLGSAASNLR